MYLKKLIVILKRGAHMEYIYPFLISFMLVFFSELGDKTQLLVLSFSAKSKAKNILLGVAIRYFS